MGFTIDIDTGGTFTDGFICRGDQVETVKVPTTPHDLTVCFLECVKAGAERFGLPLEDLLHDTEIVRFSNTIGTTTSIRRDGAKMGLIMTRAGRIWRQSGKRRARLLWWRPIWWWGWRRRFRRPARW